MSAYEFSSAAVIGTGMMGPGIAVSLALGGVPAVILSRSQERAEHGVQAARAQLRTLDENGLLPKGRIGEISASTDLDGVVRSAAIVIESAPEDLSLKQQLFADMDALNPTAVLASNTSGLSITAVAARCSRPERVMTTHFWNPPHLVPLVEIVKGEHTDDAAAMAVRDLLADCGKVPVLVRKDRPGQLGNRLQMALLREAAYMISEGIATAEDIDLAIKNGLGLRYPAYSLLEHQDLVGLDLAVRVCDYVARDLNSDRCAPQYLKNLVQSGHLGAKTGSGFHSWSPGDADAVRSRRDRFLLDQLRSRRTSSAEGR